MSSSSLPLKQGPIARRTRAFRAFAVIAGRPQNHYTESLRHTEAIFPRSAGLEWRTLKIFRSE